MRTLAFTILIAFFTTPIFAQKSLELGIGTGLVQRQDMTVTPMVDNAIAPLNARLAFDWKRKNQSRAEVRFGNYKTSASDEYNYISEFDGAEETANRHQFMRLELNYSYLLDVKKSEKIKWSLGAATRNRLMVGWYDFAVYDGLFNYNFSFGLDALISAEYDLNTKDHFYGQINLPILAFSARNPYLSQDSKWMEDNISGKDLNSVINMIGNSTLRSWGTYRTFDLTLAWNHDLNNKWGFGARYMFGAIRNTVPTKFTAFENVLQLNLRRKL